MYCNILKCFQGITHSFLYCNCFVHGTRTTFLLFDSTIFPIMGRPCRPSFLLMPCLSVFVSQCFTLYRASSGWGLLMLLKSQVASGSLAGGVGEGGWSWWIPSFLPCSVMHIPLPLCTAVCVINQEIICYIMCTNMGQQCILGIVACMLLTWNEEYLVRRYLYCPTGPLQTSWLHLPTVQCPYVPAISSDKKYEFLSIARLKDGGHGFINVHEMYDWNIWGYNSSVVTCMQL